MSHQMADEIDPEFEALINAVQEAFPAQARGVVETFAQSLFDQGVRKTVPLGADPLDNGVLVEEMLTRFEAILSDPPNQMTLAEAVEENAPRTLEEQVNRLQALVEQARQAPLNPAHHLAIDRILTEMGY